MCTDPFGLVSIIHMAVKMPNFIWDGSEACSGSAWGLQERFFLSLSQNLEQTLVWSITIDQSVTCSVDGVTDRGVMDDA